MRDGLAWAQSDRTTEKGIDGAYVGVQIGQTIMTVLPNGDFAISFASKQLVQQIGYGDAAVTRELKTLEKCSLGGNRLAAPVAGDAVVEQAVEIVQHRRRAYSGRPAAAARHCWYRTACAW